MSDKYVIVTLNDDTNYGNRLQNYALVRILSQYGVVTTAYCAGLRKLPAPIAKVFHRSVKIVKYTIKGIKSRHLFLMLKQYSRFRSFTKKKTPSSVNIDVFSGVHPKETDASFVFGSDQIWNYANADLKDGVRLFSLYLGSFLPDDVKRISYAASIGTSVMPPDDVWQAFRTYLPKFHALSVREYAGCEIIRDSTGLEAKVVLDPTLMLTRDDWLAITEDFVPRNEKYVLTYFLGDPTEEQLSCINSYARQHDCVVRNMLDINDSRTYIAAPQDFVELFSKAQYVFTDSYHACCFSILFNKQFSVYMRTGKEGSFNMNSRMETLFRLFDLKSMVLREGIAPRIDYTKVQSKLMSLRYESFKWLESSLSR